MTLTAFEVSAPYPMRPAPAARPWMDATNQSFANRCLPLRIANAHGWEILSPRPCAAAWSGWPDKSAMLVTDVALSHFGHGVLTFNIPFLFRTAPGYDLMVQGPVNSPKDGIYPLQGVVETDTAVATFTMNWIFTRPGNVFFDAGEPICHIFPVRRDYLETLDPVILPIDAAEPKLAGDYRAWDVGRRHFNQDLEVPGSAARDARWQKDYFQAADRTRVKLKDFERP